MTPEQKTMLEAQTLNKINQALEVNDSQIIGLIKFSKSHDLFFPQLYEMWFIAKISQTGFQYSGLSIINEHECFGLGIETVSALFERLFNERTDSFLKSVQDGAFHTVLSNALHKGVFLPHNVMEELAPHFSRRAHVLEELKELNGQNYHRHLDTKVSGKIRDFSKIKI